MVDADKIKSLREKTNKLSETLAINVAASESAYKDARDLMSSIIELYTKYCPCDKKLLFKQHASGIEYDIGNLNYFTGLEETLIATKNKQVEVYNNAFNIINDPLEKLSNKFFYLKSEYKQHYLQGFGYFDKKKLINIIENYELSNDSERAIQNNTLTDAMFVISKTLVDHLCEDNERISLGEGVKDILSILSDAFKLWEDNTINKKGKKN